jgi:solute carrier family 25 oxoglutarate transporter 11
MHASALAVSLLKTMPQRLAGIGCDKPVVPLAVRGALGAVAGIGGSFIGHPFDVMRVQLQVSSRGADTKMPPRLAQAARAIHARSGLAGFYAGLTAAWLRQLTYGATRLGTYSWLHEHARAAHAAGGAAEGSDLPLTTVLGAGLAAGALGAVVGTPAELALVRMAADAKLPVAQQRRYRSALDALVRVTREEGAAVLWRGAAPTVSRAALLNMAQLGLYSQTKARLCAQPPGRPLPLGASDGGLATMFLASLASSFVGVGISMPLDVAKSRLQSMASTSPSAAAGEGVGGGLGSATAAPYRGTLDCLRQSVRNEGPAVLWRGFVPAWMKLAPYTVVSFVLLEKLTAQFTGGSFA